MIHLRSFATNTEYKELSLEILYALKKLYKDSVVRIWDKDDLTVEIVKYADNYEHGYGFCVFNDLAYTAINLINQNLVKKILILDLDVHQGDGTIDICKKYSSIFTCSVHSESNFPYEKKQGSMDVSLQSEIKDEEYLQILNSTIKTIKKKVIPDIVLYDAGVDVFADDKLGNLKLSLEGIKKRDHLVLDHFRKLDIPVATVIGGGYSKDIQELANRHSIIFETALNFLKK